PLAGTGTESNLLWRLLAEDLGHALDDAGGDARRLLVAPHRMEQLEAHQPNKEHDQHAGDHDGGGQDAPIRRGGHCDWRAGFLFFRLGLGAFDFFSPNSSSSSAASSSSPSTMAALRRPFLATVAAASSASSSSKATTWLPLSSSAATSSSVKARSKSELSRSVSESSSGTASEDDSSSAG